MDNMEVFTTVDKAKRDELFNELRERGLPNERQAVRFSGQQPVLGEDGKQEVREVAHIAFGKGGKLNVGKTQLRLVWQSNWSVAYPRELPKRKD